MQADKVLFNGRIYTMDREVPLARAVAIRSGQVVALGDDAEVRSLAGAETELQDLRGRTVLPGFADAHIHLVSYGLSLTRVQLDGVPTVEEAVSRVEARIRVARPGEIVLGHGWNRSLWAGSRFPSKRDLDPVSPRNPVYLSSKDGHAAWANSLAMQMAGLADDTPDPPGGQYERDLQTGELTGIVKEGPAMAPFRRAAPGAGLSERCEAIRQATDRLHRFGIVSVHVPEEAEDLAAIQTLWLAGDLHLRVHMMIPESVVGAAREMGMRGGLGDAFLRLSSIKIFADGSLGARTADMLEPYDDEPGNLGIQVTDSNRLNGLVAECTAAGWSAAIHAIGDRANRRALDALEQHRTEWSRLGLRPRIEHAQLLSAQDVARFGSMGVVASVQPVHCTSDRIMADRHWGKRCSGAYAWRSVLESGGVLAFGSDAPVEEPDVLRGIFAAVTRQREDGTPTDGWYPEQRLTVPEAVHAYTMGAAYASDDERCSGSLGVGKHGDMVVLSQDIFHLQPRELLTTKVEATILAGEVVFGQL